MPNTNTTTTSSPNRRRKSNSTNLPITRQPIKRHTINRRLTYHSLHTLYRNSHPTTTITSKPNTKAHHLRPKHIKVTSRTPYHHTLRPSNSPKNTIRRSNHIIQQVHRHLIHIQTRQSTTHRNTKLSSKPNRPTRRHRQRLHIHRLSSANSPNANTTNQAQRGNPTHIKQAKIAVRAGALISVSNIVGHFNDFITIRQVSLSVHGNRFLTVVKSDNYNGAAALQVLTNLRTPDRNIVQLTNRPVGSLPA